MSPAWISRRSPTLLAVASDRRRPTKRRRTLGSFAHWRCSKSGESKLWGEFRRTKQKHKDLQPPSGGPLEPTGTNLVVASPRLGGPPWLGPGSATRSPPGNCRGPKPQPNADLRDAALAPNREQFAAGRVGVAQRASLLPQSPSAPLPRQPSAPSRAGLFLAVTPQVRHHRREQIGGIRHDYLFP